MSSRSVNMDRLSVFPDEILAHILSLMPTKSAVGTSILSKRWRHCWTLVHSFDFKYIDRTPGSDRFLSFVDRVMKLCKTSQIKSFRLHSSEFLVGNSHVDKWINEAIKLNVCELDIQVIMRELPFSVFTCKTLTKLSELPFSVFTCKTLTKLSLALGCYGYGQSDVFNIPSGVILPCVKTLDIGVFSEPFAHVYNLIGGCPILENFTLSIEERRRRAEKEGYNFNIPTLKRFELRTPRRTSDVSKVVLNVPNLKYLILRGFLCSVFVMEDLPSLVEATVSYSEVGYKHLMIELLKGLSETKALSWSTTTIGVPLDFPLLEFPNLKHLEFRRFSCFGWFLMFEVLHRSCKLEHLCIEEPEEFCWNEPLSIPTCTFAHLRTMKFISFKKRKCDIKFVEYLLANAKVLKTLTITSEICTPADEMWLCAQLLKFPRASGCCEIHIVRKWSHIYK